MKTALWLAIVAMALADWRVLADEVDDTITSSSSTTTTTTSATARATSRRPPPKCTGFLGCPIEYVPVCTTRGTYRHECEFDNAYCEKPSDDFYIEFDGDCGDFHTNAMDEDDEENGGVTTDVLDVPIELSEYVAPAAKIDCSDGRIQFDPEYVPLCTSYGTYRNLKEAYNAYCEKPSPAFYIIEEGVECEESYNTQSIGEDEMIVTADVLNVPIDLDDDTTELGDSENGEEPDATVDVMDPPEAMDETPEDRVETVDPPPSPRVNYYCELSCPTGEMAVAPICGTDTRSYINACHLLSTKCQLPELEKQYDGLCVVGGGRAPVRAGDSLQTQEFRKQCNSYCGKSYEPWCGSNGETYVNECLIDYAICMTPSITKLGQGKCSELFGGGGEGPTGGCDPKPCPPTEAPVCGSDGQTYDNVCHLENAACQVPGIHVFSNGPCDASTVFTCATLTCPLYTECREQPGTGVAYCADVCHPRRCADHEECRLLKSECRDAACSLVATCVPKGLGDYS